VLWSKEKRIKKMKKIMKAVWITMLLLDAIFVIYFGYWWITDKSLEYGLLMALTIMCMFQIYDQGRKL
jgi:hypothetical protein